MGCGRFLTRRPILTNTMFTDDWSPVNTPAICTMHYVLDKMASSTRMEWPRLLASNQDNHFCIGHQKVKLGGLKESSDWSSLQSGKSPSQISLIIRILMIFESTANFWEKAGWISWRCNTATSNRTSFDLTIRNWRMSISSSVSLLNGSTTIFRTYREEAGKSPWAD